MGVVCSEAQIGFTDKHNKQKHNEISKKQRPMYKAIIHLSYLINSINYDMNKEGNSKHIFKKITPKHAYGRISNCVSGIIS